MKRRRCRWPIKLSDFAADLQRLRPRPAPAASRRRRGRRGSSRSRSRRRSCCIRLVGGASWRKVAGEPSAREPADSIKQRAGWKQPFSFSAPTLRDSERTCVRARAPLYKLPATKTTSQSILSVPCFCSLVVVVVGRSNRGGYRTLAGRARSRRRRPRATWDKFENGN